MVKRAGDSIRSFLVTGVFFYLQFFGLFASYKLDRFVLGLMVPPVAWFDSIYYWFTPPEWQKDWDTKVQALASVMFAQVGELGKNQLHVEGQLREWVAMMPESRKAQLKARFRLFVDAMATHAIEVATTKDNPTTSTDGFAEEPGLVRVWTQYKAGLAVSVKSDMEASGPISAGREKTIRQNMKQIAGVLNSKIDSWL